MLRIFTGRAKANGQADFAKKLKEVSAPLVLRQRGLTGYYAGEPMGEGERDFVMMTIWRDIEALEQFAGQNWQEPVIPPGYEDILERWSVQHYRLLDKQVLE